jgi:hypothetical protein
LLTRELRFLELPFFEPLCLLDFTGLMEAEVVMVLLAGLEYERFLERGETGSEQMKGLRVWIVRAVRVSPQTPRGEIAQARSRMPVVAVHFVRGVASFGIWSIFCLLISGSI